MLKLRKPVTAGTRMVLTVHDELVFEVPQKEVKTASQRIKDLMENVYLLDVPLVVDVGSGKNWNAAK
jgi:DNA polymerase-1